MKRLSVVVPIYNEEQTVLALLGRVAGAPLPDAIDELEVVVVDDGSSDGSWQRLESWRLAPREDGRPVERRLLRHERNRGKGAALRTGFAAVTGELVLVQDADLEYDPAQYPILLQPILDGLADVVFGSRFLGGPHRVLFFWHYLGNRFLTLVSNVFTDLNLTDMETCYKVFRAELLRGLTLRSNRFGFEPEVTARIARTGCRIYEVPIAYHGRTYAEGKKIGWRDGVAAIWTILKYNTWARQRR
jgi:glycosyltransferase involved in cell wall biosynthesis